MKVDARAKVVIGGATALLVVACGMTAWAATVPQAVSPGGSAQVARVGSGCPTFSWTEVSEAKRYELVVYAVAEGSVESTEVLRQSLPGGATTWTPSLDGCLERGGRYAWSVRAEGGKGVTEWSEPSLFEVTAGPSQAELEAALEIVRQYTGDVVAAASEVEGELSTGERTASSSGSSAAPAVAEPAPLAAGVGDSALLVNDSPVLTASSAGSLVLCAHQIRGGWRYWDLGDGTVLDCNTGLVWLKDASCADLEGTNAEGRGNWTIAVAAAAALSDGTCGLTDGSEPGDWRLPEVGEFCSNPPGGSRCSSDDAPDSLVNTNFLFPAVSNAAGDGQWAEGDAFVGVQNNFYWSATAFVDDAWEVNLQVGFVDFDTKNGLDYIWPVRSVQ